MKIVHVVKIPRFTRPYAYGWYLPPKTTAVCQCIYAKLKGTTIYQDSLIESIRETYPDDKEKQLQTYNTIHAFDNNRADNDDLKNLRILAKRLGMKVVVKRL